MTKVVINEAYGGFGLSLTMEKRYWELKGQPKPEGWWDLIDMVDRDDPILVQVVEELGENSVLTVVDIRPGTKYRIQEYDGKEWIETEDDIEWSVA